MTLELYTAILLTLIVLSILIVAGAIVAALLQLRKTAQAIEHLAVRAGDQLGRVGDMAGSLGQVALGIAGAVGKKSLLSAGLLFSLFRFFRKRRKKENPFDGEKDGDVDR